MNLRRVDCYFDVDGDNVDIITDNVIHALTFGSLEQGK